MWKHSKKFKGKSFYLNAKYDKSGKRFYQFENAKTGAEMPKKYSSYVAAKKDGWLKAK